MDKVEFTEWAKDILGRSHEAARRFNPDARVRLRSIPGGMEAGLTDAPEPGDREITVGRATILVSADLEGLVDVEEPHDRLVLRPAGSTPNVREPH